MNPKERLKKVSNGQRADRIPFLPTIFEHGAGLIGKTPSEAALDEDIMAKAHLKAYEVYGHDVVTVGIDVYNIEAEALGCEIRYHKDNSIPGVITHPFKDQFSSEDMIFSLDRGRIGKVLNAASEVNLQIGDETFTGIGICGPFSVCVELCGYENIIMDCMAKGEKVHKMMEDLLGFQKYYCDEIIKRNLGVTIFESWATPPLISPEIYREFVVPYEKELIKHIKSKGLSSAPLVIGGDTGLIVDDIISTGTTLLVADYNSDFEMYLEKATENNIMLRGNIDPKLVEKGTREEILTHAQRLIEKAKGYGKFVMGTGVLPYNTPVENVLAIKKNL